MKLQPQDRNQFRRKLRDQFVIQLRGHGGVRFCNGIRGPLWLQFRDQLRRQTDTQLEDRIEQCFS